MKEHENHKQVPGAHALCYTCTSMHKYTYIHTHSIHTCIILSMYEHVYTYIHTHTQSIHTYVISHSHAHSLTNPPSLPTLSHTPQGPDPLALRDAMMTEGLSQRVCVNDLEAPAHAVLPKLAHIREVGVRSPARCTHARARACMHARMHT